MRLCIRVSVKPGVGSELFALIPKVKGCAGARPARIFPFSLGREPVTIRVEMADPAIGVVARSQTFCKRARVAELRCCHPSYLLDWLVGRFAAGRIAADEFLVLLLSNFVAVDQEALQLHL